MDRVKDAMVAGNRKGVETTAEWQNVSACRRGGDADKGRALAQSGLVRLDGHFCSATSLSDPGHIGLSYFHWDVQAPIARERVPQMQRLEPSLTTPTRRHVLPPRASLLRIA
jgi:hypothetical protein